MLEKRLLAKVRHVALATVSEDGSPHNSPLFFAFDNDLTQLYFVSRSESLHSKNFVRTGKAFAVVYDSNEFNGGIYVTIENGRKLDSEEALEALKIYMERCREFDIDVLPKDFHLQSDGYNLYAGDIVKIEVYSSTEDTEGKLINETRKEINAQELL